MKDVRGQSGKTSKCKVSVRAVPPPSDGRRRPLLEVAEGEGGGGGESKPEGAENVVSPSKRSLARRLSTSSITSLTSSLLR